MKVPLKKCNATFTPHKKGEKFTLLKVKHNERIHTTNNTYIRHFGRNYYSYSSIRCKYAMKAKRSAIIEIAKHLGDPSRVDELLHLFDERKKRQSITEEVES